MRLLYQPTPKNWDLHLGLIIKKTFLLNVFLVYNSLVYEGIVKIFIEKIENNLEFPSNDTLIPNIPQSTFDAAGEMFIYLSFCPNEFLGSKLTKAFIQYISKANLNDLIMFLTKIKRKSIELGICSKLLNV